MRRAWVVVVLALVGCGGDPRPGPTAGPSPVAVAAERVAVAATTGHAGELAGAAVLDPGAARLRGPHAAVAVSAVGRSGGALPDTVAGVFELPAPAVPAPGQEFLLLDLADPEQAPGAAGPSSTSGPSGTPGSPSGAPGGPSGIPGSPSGTPGGPGVPGAAGGAEVVVVAGAARRVVPATAGGSVLVSVPTGAPAALELTDAGRTQSLDLATGRRTAEVAGYYPLRTGSAGPTAPPTTLVLYGAGVAGQPKGDRTASIGLDRATATLQPYAEGRGWAAEGRAYLVLDATLGYDRPGAARPDAVTVPAACFTAGPVRLAGPPLTVRGPTGTARLVADVPAATARVTVRFAFRGTVRAAAGEVTFQPAGGGPQTATVTLG